MFTLNQSKNTKPDLTQLTNQKDYADFMTQLKLHYNATSGALRKICNHQAHISNLGQL